MFVKNKVALITGGASGFGLCFVKEFLKNGIRGVTLVDINAKYGQEIISSLEEEFGPNKAIFVKVDVANQDEFEDAFKKTIETFGNIDIVINNAGILNECDFRRTIDVNLNGVIIGTFLAMDHYLPKYKTSDNPVIVNISSLYGLDPCPCSVVYSAAKHGIIGLGKCLSDKRHFEETGVKILTICPGHSVTAIAANTEEKHLPGRYRDIVRDLIQSIQPQPAEVLAKALTKIFEKFDTGEVWLVEDSQCHQLEIPDRFSLRKIRSFEV